jgi:hypothetical protein
MHPQQRIEHTDDIIHIFFSNIIYISYAHHNIIYICIYGGSLMEP